MVKLPLLIHSVVGLECLCLECFICLKGVDVSMDFVYGFCSFTFEHDVICVN